MKSLVNPTVLLVTTKNWVPTARLAIALGKAGFRVEAVCPPRHPIRDTQAAAATYAYHGLAPLLCFRQALVRTKPDLVVPGDDLAVQHLHDLYQSKMDRRGGNEGGSASGFSIPSVIERSLGSPASFAVTDSRAAFIALAREEGIRVPETKIVNESEDVAEWIRRVGLPTVLKSDGSSGGEGVRIVRDAEEAQRAFQRLRAAPLLARACKRALLDGDSTLVWPSLLRHRPVVNAQKMVPGHEATSTVACWEGRVLGSLHFEVLRKSHSAGHATVVRWIENQEMSDAVRRMVRRMGLSGLCGFDFMLEANTGHAYLIEINPRATQVGHIGLGAGRDLAGALYDAVLGSGARAREWPAHAGEARPAVTENNTIALFPHEWARDPQSEFLRSAYHDVPWETPELVHACIRRSRQQRVWYSRENRDGATTEAALKVDPLIENRLVENRLAENLPHEKA